MDMSVRLFVVQVMFLVNSLMNAWNFVENGIEISSGKLKVVHNDEYIEDCKIT